MKRKDTFRKCFIVAPYNVNPGPIRRLLEERNIEVHEPFDVPEVFGLSIASSIQKQIDSSDFVIAVISLKKPNPNVFYELGLARGLGKPTFLIITEEGAFPADLRDMVYVKASLNDSDPISFALDQFLSKYEYRPTKFVPIFRERAKTKLNVEPLKRKLEILAKRGTEKELEFFIVELLKLKGIIHTQYQGVEGKGADMALWADSLESSLGNPILVEVKMGRLSGTLLLKAEEQLRTYLKMTNARAGLLIYLDRSGRRFKQARFKWPLVIRFDARDFLSELSKQSLANVLLSERNRIVHTVR